QENRGRNLRFPSRKARIFPPPISENEILFSEPTDIPIWSLMIRGSGLEGPCRPWRNVAFLDSAFGVLGSSAQSARPDEGRQGRGSLANSRVGRRDASTPEPPRRDRPVVETGRGPP